MARFSTLKNEINGMADIHDRDKRFIIGVIVRAEVSITSKRAARRISKLKSEVKEKYRE